MNRILILGASGFIGNILYKELRSYFDVYGTYRTPSAEYEDNQIMFRFDLEKDDVEETLNKVRPNFVISSLRGESEALIKTHNKIFNYVTIQASCRLIYLSSVNVFDAHSKFPSYEYDRMLAASEYGKLKISIEKLYSALPHEKVTILRLPIVLGINSPRIQQIKQAIKHNAEFEVYPNLIVSVSTAKKIAQQVHFIINKGLYGIYHLASEDVIHHQDLFQEIAERLGDKTPIFKSVYQSNEDRYLAILPKENKLPKNYRISVAEVIEDSTLKDEISTLKLP